MHPKTETATTNVAEFIEDIEGGRFDQMLSAAMSQTAKSVVGADKKGKVNISFEFEGIKGAQQVRIVHKIEFKKPTDRGHVIEHDESSTVFFVGANGELSLAQPSLLGKQGALAGLAQ